MPSIFDFIDNDRSIYLFSEVWQGSAQHLISDLLRLNEESKDKSINIFINSRGGMTLDSLGIVDVMKSIKAPINTIVLGQGSSAASLIAACGTKGRRFISPNSQIMIHEAAMQGFGFIDTRDEKFQKSLDWLKKLNTRINKIYAQITGKSFEEIDKIMSSKDDIWMEADEAVKFGLADEIMTSEQINSIKLSEQFKNYKFSEEFNYHTLKEKGDLKPVHLLKVCSLKERGVEITTDTLKSIKTNFDNGVRGQDISIEYNTHENENGEHPAAAWIKELYLDGDNKNLFGKVEYSPTAEKMIKDKEYKYLSVEIDPLYQNENGKMFNNVLLGATFTNRPAVKGLNPLKLSENINNNKKIDMELNKSEITSIENVKSKLNMKIEDIYDSFVAMTEKNIALEDKKKDLTNNVKKLEIESKAAKEKVLKIEKEQIDAEKIATVDSLINKGIITTANKEKVLKQFSSKSAIDDFYKDTPAIVSVEPKGDDLGESDPDSDIKKRARDISKQSGQSEKDVLNTLKSKQE